VGIARPNNGEALEEGERGADVLVLADPRTFGSLAFQMPGLSVRVLERSESFLTELSDSRPRVALVYLPPATLHVIASVAALRRRRTALRSILVNELDGVEARLQALDAGFDEALTSLVTTEELVGRLTILARAQRNGRDRLAVGEGSELDLATRRLVRDGRAVHLRPKEFRLLEALARHPGRVQSRSQLLDRVWGPGHAGDPRTVDVHIRWLRAKVEPNPDRPVHLVTVRGMGYRLDPGGELEQPNASSPLDGPGFPDPEARAVLSSLTER
jgi:DNA-binding response OmpR family regulator